MCSFRYTLIGMYQLRQNAGSASIVSSNLEMIVLL